jgi:hypothetical protein
MGEFAKRNKPVGQPKTKSQFFKNLQRIVNRFSHGCGHFIEKFDGVAPAHKIYLFCYKDLLVGVRCKGSVE